MRVKGVVTVTIPPLDIEVRHSSIHHSEYLVVVSGMVCNFATLGIDVSVRKHDFHVLTELIDSNVFARKNVPSRPYFQEVSCKTHHLFK